MNNTQSILKAIEQNTELPRANEAIRVLVEEICKTISGDEIAHAELRKLGVPTDERTTNSMKAALTRTLAILTGIPQ